MMTRVWALALNTYREAVRQKILYGLVFFSVVLILFSLFLGQLSLGADTKIIKDMGLASIMVFGALISIFVGIGLIFKEVDRRTIHTILSKPVSRAEFVLGKFLGLAMTIALEVLAMSALIFAVLSLYREPLDFNLLKAVLLIYAELCILVAVVILFSSYSSSFMSSLFCLSFLIVGHVMDDFAGVIAPKVDRILAEGTGIDLWGGYILLGIMQVLTIFNLDHFAINAEVVHGVPVSWRWIGISLFYAFCWLVILLFSATWLFQRKDLH